MSEVSQPPKEGTQTGYRVGVFVMTPLSGDRIHAHIEPPVEGVYRWYGTKTLGFRPDHPLLDLPRYMITVSGKASSLSGLKLKDDFSFDIFGEGVKIVNMFPGNDADVAISLYDVPTAIAREITLEFNQPVDSGEIGRSIRVDGENKSFSFIPQILKYRSPGNPAGPGYRQNRMFFRRMLLGKTF